MEMEIKDWRVGDIKWMGQNNTGYNAKLYYKNKFVLLCVQTHPKAEKRYIWDKEGKKYVEKLNEVMYKNNKTLEEYIDIYLNEMKLLMNKVENEYPPEPNNIRISTMTIICQLKFKDNINEEVYIDLRTLVQYIKLNDTNKYPRVIQLGKKVNNKKKKNKEIEEEDIKKKCFYNQVTLLVSFKEFNVNVKVFKNGQLQMTGCKSEDNAIETAQIIGDILLKTTDDIVIDTILDNNDKVYKCKFNKVYSIIDEESGDAEPIGYYEVEERNSKLRGQKRLYILDKETEKYNCVFYSDENTLIWEMFTNKLYRKIYNTNCEHIGEERLIFNDEYKDEYQELDYIHKNNAIFSKDNNNRRVKFILKDDMTIENRSKQKVGVIYTHYFIDDFKERYKTFNKDKKTLVTWYETVRYGKGRGFMVINMKIGMINTDYNCNFEINRMNLNKILITEYNLESILKMEKYPGVNTKFYTNDINYNNNNTFICICDEENCECSRVTVLTFKSGRIIITGAKKLSHIRDVYVFFNYILKKHYNEISIRR